MCSFCFKSFFLVELSDGVKEGFPGAYLSRSRARACAGFPLDSIIRDFLGVGFVVSGFDELEEFLSSFTMSIRDFGWLSGVSSKISWESTPNGFIMTGFEAFLGGSGFFLVFS